MCKSMKEGGQRCAAHTRARLETAAKRMRETAESCRGPEDLTHFHRAREDWEAAAAEYASTPTGRAALALKAKEAEAAGDAHTATMLNNVVRRGDMLREINGQVRAALLAAAVTEKGLPGEKVSALSQVEDENGNALSAEAEAEWGRLLDAVSAESDSADLSAYLDELTKANRTIASSSSTDKDLCTAVWSLSQGLDEDPAYQVHRLGEFSERTSGSWKVERQAREHKAALLDQMRRAIRHPQAGEDTWYRAGRHLPPNEVLGNPRCPIALTGRQPGTAIAELNEDTWKVLRGRSHESIGTAILLASHDPNEAAREDAQQQIAGAKWDTLNHNEMRTLRDALPKCLPPGQAKVVETSMVTWVKNFGTDDHKLYVLLPADRNSHVPVPARETEPVRAGFFRRN